MNDIKGHCRSDFIEIQNIFADSIKSGHETGASIAIEYKGEMIVDLYGGYKDAAKSVPWDKNTLVNVFSVTKGVTAACVAMLVDQGKLDVHSKVSDYWPEYGCNGKENTKVIDFLCHRSNNFGFRDGIPMGSWQNWDIFTQALAEQEPFGEPGSSQGYHAVTYGWLVGEIIKRVDGRDVGTFFKEEISDPFNINFKIGLSDEDKINLYSVEGQPQPKLEDLPKEKISKIISRLPPYFKRIHRSFIVNSQKVSSYNSEFISVEGSQIPISRTYKKDIITYLNKI